MLGFTVERLKTGTSARVDGRSIDFRSMTEQKGDGEKRCFSYMNDEVKIKNEKSCYITHTNEAVHKALKAGMEFSPLFTGRIKGRGPQILPERGSQNCDICG